MEVRTIFTVGQTRRLGIINESKTEFLVNISHEMSLSLPAFRVKGINFEQSSVSYTALEALWMKITLNVSKTLFCWPINVVSCWQIAFVPLWRGVFPMRYAMLDDRMVWMAAYVDAFYISIPMVWYDCVVECGYLLYGLNWSVDISVTNFPLVS